MQMGVGAANEPNHVKKKKEEKRKTKEARIIHRTRLLTDGSIKKRDGRPLKKHGK